MRKTKYLEDPTRNSPSNLPLSQTPGAARVALAGMLGLAIAMGIGRFAYTPLLPLMLEEQQLSVQRGSLLAGVNLIGYLLGSMSGIGLAARYLTLLVSGLTLTALSALTMGLTQSIPAWYVLRGMAGVASAWALVGITNRSLIQLGALGRSEYRGVVFSGPGVGIMLSGLLVAAFHGAGLFVATTWLALGIFAAITSVLVVSQMATSLRPGFVSLAITSQPRSAPFEATVSAGGTVSAARLAIPKAILTVCYGLAGYGYITTASFLPLITSELLKGSSAQLAVWLCLGFMAAVGAIVLGFSHARHNTLLLSFAYVAQAAGVVAPVLMHSLVGLVISSSLVGLTLMVIVMLTMDEARIRYDDPSLIARLTTSYAAGQIAGPYSADLILRMTHSFLPALQLSSIGLLLAAGLVWVEHRVWKRSVDMPERAKMK